MNVGREIAGASKGHPRNFWLMPSMPAHLLRYRFKFTISAYILDQLGRSELQLCVLLQNQDGVQSIAYQSRLWIGDLQKIEWERKADHEFTLLKNR